MDLVARARRELTEANAGLPPRESTAMLASLGYQINLQGEACKISLNVPGTQASAQVVLRFLDERRQADPPGADSEDRHASQPAEVGSEPLEACVEACAGRSGEGLGGRGQSPPGGTRECTLCSAFFTPNRRHLKTHIYCSASCRSKARHRQNRAHALNEGLSEVSR